VAKMYPQSLPADVASAAERLLYAQFQVQLPADFTVLHGVSWLVRDRRHRDEDGELDFLLVHPRLGLMVLEVKGGAIGCRAGTWYSRSRSGEEHPIKNPFDQARSNKYKLLDQLGWVPATSPYVGLYNRHLSHAVAFPDTADAGSSIGLYGDSTIMLDSADLHQLEATVHRLMGHTDQSYLLPAEAIKALVETLAPTRELPALGLASAILHEQTAFRILTEGQFHLLNLLGKTTQAAIGGCAGAGKTMLAMEKARRLAAEGWRVLFVCFNYALADTVEAGLQQVAGQLTVRHYARLVRDLCKAAGIELPNEKKLDEAARQEFFNMTMPLYLEQAATLLKTNRYDAIIVDEGQDFFDLWLSSLRGLLADEAGVFYVFYDDNQRVYGAERVALADWSGPRFNLDVNCRNTQRIHAEVLRYYQGEQRPTALGPDGRQPTRYGLQQDDATNRQRVLRQVLAELVQHQGLPTRDLVILTPLSEERSAFKDGLKLGNLRLSWHRKQAVDEVKVSTIYRFKGLERAVVLLAELAEAREGMERDYLMYVALSRACNQLIVVGELPQPAASGQAADSRLLLVEADDEATTG